MAFVMDPNGALQFRDQLITQQSAIAAIQLLALNNLQHALEFSKSNDKINEQKEFNNLLFLVTLLEVAIKKLNLQTILLLTQQQRVDEFQRSEENETKISRLKNFQDDEFFIQLENQKSLQLKNQMLINKIFETELKIAKMIEFLTLRNSDLNASIDNNIHQNKNQFENIVKNISYNDKPLDLKVGENTIHFNEGELIDTYNNKMASRMEAGSLNSGNFFNESREVFKEIIEDKCKELGADNRPADIDSIVEQEYFQLEKQIVDSPEFENFLQNLDDTQNMLDERNSNDLKLGLLHQNLSDLELSHRTLNDNSNEQLVLSVQENLNEALSQVSLIEATDPDLADFLMDDEEELLADDEELIANEESLQIDEDVKVDDILKAKDGHIFDESKQQGPPGGAPIEIDEPAIAHEDNNHIQQAPAAKPVSSSGSIFARLNIKSAPNFNAEQEKPQNPHNADNVSENKISPVRDPDKSEENEQITPKRFGH